MVNPRQPAETRSNTAHTSDKTAERAKDTGDDWAPTAFPGGVSIVGRRRDRGAGACHHLQFQPDSAVKSVGAQCHQESTLGLIFDCAFTPDSQKVLGKTVRTYPKTKVYDLESALTSRASAKPSSPWSRSGALPHRLRGPDCGRHGR